MSEDATAGLQSRLGVSPVQLGVGVVVAAALVTLPFWTNTSLIYTMTIAGIWAVFAAGWDIISGHTGYISFGHSLLSGSAAYATALLISNVDPNLSLAVTVPASIVAAIAVGMLFGLPSLRLRGPYFSLVTFTSVLIALKLINIFSGVTSGNLGISGIPVFTYDNTTFYYYTLALVAVVGGALLYISRSNTGRILLAINEREQTVSEAGIDTTKFKLWAFLLSAIAMSFGGIFLVHFYGTASPGNSLATTNSILIIAMAAVGGTGTILGPMAGAYLLIFLRDVVLQSWLGVGSNLRLVVLWAIVLILLILVPDGIFVRVWHRLGEGSLEGLASRGSSDE